MASSATPARTDHGDVAQHGHEHRAVVVNGISSDDEPSVQWGWHAHFPKVAHFAGFICAAICLIMIHGNHVGKQEDVWLVVLAVAFFSLSLGAIIRNRTSWRR
ncbi:DUF2631 domain-containing protein [Actinomycetospora sp.]|uniref:DUF2631 domain-containing protein n=1 Tax=Actinomycetospora sp. TaxID=1872135 RepID=UPI002F41DC3D